MASFKIGDIVSRKSYGCDVIFRVAEIKHDGNEEIIILKGISNRCIADANESDLVMESFERVVESRTHILDTAEKKKKEIAAR